MPHGEWVSVHCTEAGWDLLHVPEVMRLRQGFLMLLHQTRRCQTPQIHATHGLLQHNTDTTVTHLNSPSRTLSVESDHSIYMILNKQRYYCLVKKQICMSNIMSQKERTNKKIPLLFEKSKLSSTSSHTLSEEKLLPR